MLNSDNSGVESADFAAFEDGVYAYSKRGPSRKVASRGDPLRATLETLYSEHRYIAYLLDAIEEQEKRMRPGKVPDYNLLLDILDYLTHYPDKYHHPREDMLFAHMLESDREFQSRLDRLRREHKTLRHYNNELFNELTRIAAGRPVDQAGLKKSIQRYLTGYRKHIDYESKKVFPGATGELDPADLEKLEANTRFSDDPVFGTDVQYKYRRLARRVQAKVEVASQQLIAREMSGIESAITNLTGVLETLGSVRTAIDDRGRGAWQEQLETIKAHTPWQDGPSFLFLPLALASNHGRQVKEGFKELRGILGRRRKVGGGPEQSKRSTRSKKGK